MQNNEVRRAHAHTPCQEDSGWNNLNGWVSAAHLDVVHNASLLGLRTEYLLTTVVAAVCACFVFTVRSDFLNI